MKALRFVLLGIAFAVLASLGWHLSHPGALRRIGPSSSTPQQTTTPPEAAEQKRIPDAAEARTIVLSRLADVPEYVPFFDRLRVEFPSEYMALVDANTAAVARGAHPPNPDRLIADAVRNLRQSRGVLAAQAQAQPLASIFAAQGAILDTLAASDPGLCVDFLYGGMSPTFMAFAAKHRDLMERLAIANLSAIASGKLSHIEREQPNTADFEALTASLRANKLSDDQISALLDGKTFDPPLPEKQLCEAGRIYLHTLEAMPEDAKTRIYALSAALLARS